MLLVENVSANYGSIRALNGVTVEVAEGKMVAVVGPNGAGKSTLFKVISGIVRPTEGSVIYEGYDLLALDPAERARCGIAHVPEGRQVFKSLTVAENLQTGTYVLTTRQEKKRVLDEIYDFFPVLASRRRQQAGLLSGGQQQMLAIGRALACSPRLLMLDEPSLGLSPMLADEMFGHIESIRRAGRTTIMLVEQRVAESLQSCDWGYVLDTGTIAFQGSPADLLGDERIRLTYMGLGAPGGLQAAPL